MTEKNIRDLKTVNSKTILTSNL